jgi:hypothetical protein
VPLFLTATLPCNNACVPQDDKTPGPCDAGKKTSRHRGVSYEKQTGKWRAQIQFDGKKRHLGLYVDEGAAAAAYASACREIGRD